jgi:hypothetical protein
MVFSLHSCSRIHLLFPAWKNKKTYNCFYYTWSIQFPVALSPCMTFLLLISSLCHKQYEHVSLTLSQLLLIFSLFDFNVYFIKKIMYWTSFPRMMLSLMALLICRTWKSRILKLSSWLIKLRNWNESYMHIHCTRFAISFRINFPPHIVPIKFC